MRAVARELGRSPTRREYEQRGQFGRGVFRALGVGDGAWRGALAACGLDPAPAVPSRYIATDLLLADIRRVARVLGHQPTYNGYLEHGRYALKTVKDRFGSWPAAVEAAGLRWIGYHPRTPRITDEAITKDLRRVRYEIGRVPSAADYDVHGQHNATHLAKRAGGWRNVLQRFLGVSEDEASAASHPNYRSTEERLEEIRALAARLGHTPSHSETNRHGVKPAVLIERLGSWSAVLEAAGLPPSGPDRMRMLDDVIRVARLVGRFPTRAEQSSQGRYKAAALMHHFKRWATLEREVLERARARGIEVAPGRVHGSTGRVRGARALDEPRQRALFEQYARGGVSVDELCVQYQISRMTFFRVMKKFR